MRIYFSCPMDSIDTIKHLKRIIDNHTFHVPIETYIPQMLNDVDHEYVHQDLYYLRKFTHQ